jgi:hypothetical protein
MGDFIKPTDGRIVGCFLNGDITGYVHCARIYESLCKPYLTVHLTLIDNDNLIENLGIRGGTACALAVQSPPNEYIYSCKVHVLNMEGHQSTTNLKTQIYEIDLVGIAYFNDKANIVQKAYTEQGTSVIQSIWGQYLQPGGDSLMIHRQSDGMLGKQEDKSQVDHKKPFAAIDEIRQYLKFGGQSSPTVFFRDNIQANLAPLKDLFQKGVTFSYIQKETWGHTWFEPDVYRAIIVAQAEIDQNFSGENSGGAGGTGAIAKAISQGQAVFDLFKGIPSKFTDAARMASGNFGVGIAGAAGGLSSAIGSIAGGLGGSPNIQYTNSNRWEDETAPHNKTMGDQSYAAEVKNAPQLKMKVPLQTGFFATVGKRVYAELLPPVGDNLKANPHRYSMTGPWLVKDLVHECYTDNRDVKATTTMQLIRGGSAT